MTALIVTVVAVWLAQRLLAARQAMKFRDQYAALRRHGDVAVGMSKRIGRRVYVALAADEDATITHNVVFRGVTVFAKGVAEPRLNGLPAAQLASGRSDGDLHPMVARAAAQAAAFLRDRNQVPADLADPSIRT